MKKILTMIAVLFTCVISQAQFKRIFKSVQNTVENNVDRKANKAVDDVFNGKPAASDKNQPATPAAHDTETPSEGKSGIGGYSKFDFVAGAQIIYANDFSGEAMGELPVGWNSGGTGEVATMDGLKGNWVQFNQDAVYLTDNKNKFTENFTVEFDLLLRRSNPKASFPQFAFGVMASGDQDPNSNDFLKEGGYKSGFATELKIQPYDHNGSHMHLQTFQSDATYLETDVKQAAFLEKFFNQPIHISMQVQKERLRIWVNETKMYDLSKGIAAGVELNQLFFAVKGGGGDNSEVGYDVTNIRIANGVPDTRHKLLDEGKFSTTGILFDINSATIKPESSGVLKEIADVLKQAGDLKIRIIGHTDSDGGDAANLDLSKKRALAVKASLVSDYGIDSSRIETDGKGETEPVADNNTKEGKAQNRRVEFVKL